MQVFLQLYVLFVISCLLLFSPLKAILNDHLLKAVVALIVYAAIVRIMAGMNPGIPAFFPVSVFVAHLLFTPAAYLYIRNQVYGRTVEKADRVHLVPFLMFTAGTIISLSAGSVWLSRDWMTSETIPGGITGLLFTMLLAFTALYFGLILLAVRYKTENMAAAGMVVSQDLAVTANTFPKPNPSEDGNAPRNAALTQERVHQIEGVVNQLLEEKKPFLQQRYSLKDLSDDTQIPLHQLSAYINRHCGKNFNDFINEFRVQYCKEKILNHECRNKKLEAVAEESGFNNRNTFAIAFKKVTGVNPSEFLKKVKTGQDEFAARMTPEARVLSMPDSVYRDVIRS